MSANHLKPKETTTRRNLIAGIGLFGLFPILKFGWVNQKKEVIGCSPVTNEKTIKFLTQDGTLVEVEASKINSLKEKISNKQLQAWIKKES